MSSGACFSIAGYDVNKLKQVCSLHGSDCLHRGAIYNSPIHSQT